MLEGETDDLDGEVGNVVDCPLESRFISVTPKDVLILRQFINRDGSLKVTISTLLPRKNENSILTDEIVLLNKKTNIENNFPFRHKNTRASPIVNIW